MSEEGFEKKVWYVVDDGMGEWKWLVRLKGTRWSFADGSAHSAEDAEKHALNAMRSVQRKMLHHGNRSMPDIVVELDKWEFMHATTIGTWRQNANVGRSDAYGFNGDGYSAHVDGCLYEYSVAKAMNLHWSGVRSNPFVLRGDVGVLQVRGSRYPTGHLLLHDRDEDESAFVFVVGDSPFKYRLVGWLKGGDAKSSEWWKDPTGAGRPCFMVPQEALRDPEELLNA